MDDLDKFRVSWKKELQERDEAANRDGVGKNRATLAAKDDAGKLPFLPFGRGNVLEGKRILDESAQDLGSCTSDGVTCRDDNAWKRRKMNVKEEERKRRSSGFLETLISDLDEINDIPFFDIEIPREIGVKIFQHLSMQDLCNCAQVSSSWRSLADDQLLWFPFYKSLGLSSVEVRVDCEPNWKAAVRDGLMQKDLLMVNWKGRIGRVTTLEHVTGGVLCAASSCDDAIIAGFSNGSVKLWKVNRHVEKEIMLCSCYDNMGLSDRPGVSRVAVNSTIAMAIYRNGNVDIWSTEHGGDPVHNYRQNNVPLSSLATDDALVASASGKELRIEAADSSGNWFTQDSITLDKYINNVKLFTSLDKRRQGNDVAIVTTSGLYIYIPAPGSRCLSLMHAFVGSCSPTCMEVISDHVACGFGVAGFRESFAVKLFDIETKNVKVRLFDLRLQNALPVMQLSGHAGAVTQVQVDEWKVLSGGEEGMVCLWDQRMQRKLWDSYARHPVRYTQFRGSSLVTANIPNIKCLEDDLETVTHKRLRGELRHYNFLADQTREGLPSVCLSSYDEPEGYNYNIKLAAPYDDL